MLRLKGLLLAVVVAGAMCGTAGATGLMIPEDKSLPPLAVKSHRVEVDIDNNVARTRVKQVFVNNTNQRMEATYVFPIPAEAALTDFAMMINGKRQAGEVVEAAKARAVYEDIVRRLRDPGLVEYMGSGLLRMRVFPIEPKSTVELDLSFSSALAFESGVYEYTFPLKTGTRASRVQDDFTFTVNIAGKDPIKNVYSPTHDVGVSRKDDRHAVVGFEQTGALLDTDFKLFYALDREDFGLNMLTHRLEGQDGYFVLMLSPRVEMDGGKVMAKDVCFVLDTSGSMQEENRMASAKDAIKFCLKALNDNDGFSIVTFSTTVDVFGAGLTTAGKDAVAKAVEFVDKIEARGGTKLCEAVVKALEMAPDGDRPYLTVLITDGKPTVGTTDPDEIVKEVQKANKDNIRVFTFGIAENLNVPLLDRIADTTRGYRAYVAPGREIETKISTFFRKVSNPVLSGLALSFGDVKVKDMYPQAVPDLFRGSQVVAFGRYDGRGDIAVQLTGTVGGERKEFAYDVSFPSVQSANDFVPQLWARRKIGYLLDQIRLQGSSDELIQEVVRLSQEYGIATPYTSYLVLENGDAYKQHGIVRGRGLDRLAEGTVFGTPTTLAPAAEADMRARTEAAERLDGMRAPLAAGPRGAGDGGKAAVRSSNALRELKDSGALSDGSEAIARARLQRVGERRFLLYRGAYVDTAYAEDMPELKIKWGSEAYFAALQALPELKPCLALGETVVVVIGKKALIVADAGEEKMSAREIKEFFKD